MKKGAKSPLAGILVIAIIVVAVIIFMNIGLKEHIEDTNGADDYSLTTITDENIINMDLGSLTPAKISRDVVGDGMTFSSDKFTGVHEILYDNFVGESDFVLNLSSLQVTGGNFRMVIVHDDEIVADIVPDPDDPFIEYRLENISGTVSLRIAGESAAYSFNMVESDYEDHAHS